MRLGIVTAAVLLAVAVPANARVVALAPQGLEAVEKREIPGRALPDSLVIEPGRYTWKTGSYRLTSGAYKFGRGRDAVHRVVFDGRPVSLVSGISSLTDHRSPPVHDSLGSSRQKEVAMVRRLRMTCGPVVTLARDLLRREGVPARYLQLLTSEPWPEDYNGTGHVLLEAYSKGRWQTFDLDIDFQPLLNGEPVTYWDFALAKRRDIHLRWLSAPRFAREGHFKRLPHWYMRLKGTPMIHGSDQRLYFNRTKGHSREEVETIMRHFGAHPEWLPRRQFLGEMYGADPRLWVP